MSKKTEKTEIDFEASMKELEAVVARMESGDLSLEDSLKEFEQGIKLTRLCQQALTDAEQRIKMLTSDGEVVDYQKDN